jgi:formate hydrogenlyase subunit 3/multisubunit Na+/H+ antiporter MnhD subunit
MHPALTASALLILALWLLNEAKKTFQDDHIPVLDKITPMLMKIAAAILFFGLGVGIIVSHHL